jgi:hypothetical protein
MSHETACALVGYVAGGLRDLGEGRDGMKLWEK